MVKANGRLAIFTLAVSGSQPLLTFSGWLVFGRPLGCGLGLVAFDFSSRVVFFF